MPVGNESNHRFDGATIEGGLAVKGPGGVTTYLASDSGSGLLTNGLTAAQVVAQGGPVPLTGSLGMGGAKLQSRAPAAPRSVIYSDLSAWTNTGSGTFTASDTTDFVYGSHSSKIATLGGGVAYTMRKLAGTAVDMSNRSFAVLAKYPSAVHTSDVSFYAGTGGFAAYRTWSFLQAVAPPQNAAAAGDWYWFTFLWDEYATQTGSPNRAALTDFQIRLVDDNTGNVATMQIGAICSIAQAVTTYPSGVCTWTFDDGWDGWIQYAAPYMDTYGWGGTGYPITDQINGGGYCTLAQLKQLEQVSGWEIGAHAYYVANHNLPAGMTSLTDAEYELDVRLQKSWLLDNGFRGHEHMAWPQGFYDPAKLAIARRYFSTARTTWSQYRDSWPCSDPLRLRWYSLGQTTNLATVQALIDAAVTAKSWLILAVHDVAVVPAKDQDVSVATFNGVCDYLATRMPVRTISQVLAGGVV